MGKGICTKRRCHHTPKELLRSELTHSLSCFLLLLADFDFHSSYEGELRVVGVHSGKRLFVSLNFCHIVLCRKAIKQLIACKGRDGIQWSMAGRRQLTRQLGRTGHLGVWGLKKHPRTRDGLGEQSVRSSTLKRQRDTFQPGIVRENQRSLKFFRSFLIGTCDRTHFTFSLIANILSFLDSVGRLAFSVKMRE